MIHFQDFNFSSNEAKEFELEKIRFQQLSKSKNSTIQNVTNNTVDIDSLFGSIETSVEDEEDINDNVINNSRLAKWFKKGLIAYSTIY